MSVRPWAFVLTAAAICQPFAFSAQPASQATTASAGSSALSSGSDGITVSGADVLADAQRIPSASRHVVLSRPDNVQRIAEGLHVRRSLAERASALKLQDDPQLAAELRLARDKILSDAYLRHLANQQAPGEEALERFARTHYQAEIQRFAVPPQTRASHILLSKQGEGARAKAEQMLAALRNGASFEDMARKESIDYASAARGGDLGFFGAGRMVKPFEEAVAALAKPGDLSDIVETQFGYHIVRLDERQTARTLPYDEVKEQIKADVLASLQSQQREQVVEAIRSKLTFDQTAIDAFAKEFAAELVQPKKP